MSFNIIKTFLASVIAMASMGGAALMLPVSPALALDFPNKPIRFIVPFPPGSGTNTSARYFGRKLTDLTGQPVLVENRPGANGFIAVRALLAAPADGYTAFVGGNSTLAVNVALFKKLPYDPQADLAPLTMMMRAPTRVVVPANSPYKTLLDLVSEARAKPGKLNYASRAASCARWLPPLTGVLRRCRRCRTWLRRVCPISPPMYGSAPWSRRRRQKLKPTNSPRYSLKLSASPKPESSMNAWALRP